MRPDGTREVLAHQSWAEAVIDGAQDIVMLVDPDGSIRSVNRAVERILGYRVADLAHAPLLDLVHPADAEQLLVWLGRSISGGRPEPLDLRCVHTDGGWVETEASAMAMVDIPDVDGVVITMRDVHESRSLEAELTHWAFHDPLTNLANRARLRDRIVAAVDRSARTNQSHPAVLLIDIDDFKTVNDSLGHQEGDRLLISVAERLRDCVEPEDTVARLGGDEFVILVDEADGTTTADLLADRILSRLSDPLQLGTTEVVVQACIGVSVADDRCSPDQLLRDADLAMYAAKSAGKATWRRFLPEMHESALNTIGLSAELRRGLVRNEFALHYQAIVSLATERIVGFEALLRWEHSERGLVSPDEFVAHAERTGLIVPIGAWAVREACSAAVSMRRIAGHEDLVMSVNVAPRQLQSDDIIDVVRSALRDTALPSDALCIEITESELADDAATVERLNQLRDLGVHLAIDDFGTGYSSYNHIHRLPVNRVKIDRTFIEGLDQRALARGLAPSIVRMCQTLGLSTVAEGVETVGQAAQLRDLGCVNAQGYLFSPPVDEQSATGLLRRASSPILPVRDEALANNRRAGDAVHGTGS
ncbi:MAG TPA: EAL domain-containing protein [Dermatophilaceae bacterium]